MIKHVHGFTTHAGRIQEAKESTDTSISVPHSRPATYSFSFTNIKTH
jgi:hypothetical protein